MNEQYKEALLELKVAESAFNNAEPAFFEAANAKLTAAMEKVNALALEGKAQC